MRVWGVSDARWAVIGLGALLAAAGCRSAEARHQRASTADRTPVGPATSDTAGPAFGDTLLTLDSAALVLFWTPPVDTLESGVREEAVAELRATAAWAGDFLESYRIPLYATRAHGVLVRPPTGGRRLVDFRGLDYPFGFVLIEPGYPEQFLTGIISEEDLRDALVDYFDLEEGDSSEVFRTGWPSGRATIPSRAIPWHRLSARLTLWNVSRDAPAARTFAADACGSGSCPERRYRGRHRHPARSGRAGT